MNTENRKTAPLHVLLTVNAAWNAWNFRRPVIEALIADGHRVTVLVPPDEAVSKLEGLGCCVLPLEMNVKGLNPSQDIQLLRRFKKIFQHEKPDVILSYTIKNNIFGAMAAKGCSIPFVPNVTGLGTAFLSGGLLQTVAENLYRRAFKQLHCVFFQNTDDQTLFLKRRLVQPDQARLLPGSGINLERFACAPYPDKSDAPVFLMIARLLRDKGAVEFFEAAKIVKAKWPAVRFQILGAVDAANRSAVDQTTVQSWQNSGVIEYLGTSDDVRPYIAKAGCVVLPSYREGAPRTLIEAAAMGRPLIATDVPGCRDIVESGVNGLLCEVRCAQSLADACLAFLSLGHTQKEQMGRAGRIKMKAAYDEVHVVNAYRKVIAELRPLAGKG